MMVVLNASRAPQTGKIRLFLMKKRTPRTQAFSAFRSLRRATGHHCSSIQRQPHHSVILGTRKALLSLHHLWTYLLGLICRQIDRHCIYLYYTDGSSDRVACACCNNAHKEPIDLPARPARGEQADDYVGLHVVQVLARVLY